MLPMYLPHGPDSCFEQMDVAVATQLPRSDKEAVESPKLLNLEEKMADHELNRPEYLCNVNKHVIILLFWWQASADLGAGWEREPGFWPTELFWVEEKLRKDEQGWREGRLTTAFCAWAAITSEDITGQENNTSDLSNDHYKANCEQDDNYVSFLLNYGRIE